MNSLGVFHHSLSVSLASFAKQVSAGDHDRQSRPGQRRVDPTFTSFTQGRLRLHTALRTRRHDAPHCRFIICFVHGSAYHNGSTSTHKSRSPRKPGRSVYAVTPRPETLTPSTHPDLGEKSKHQGLHRYALKRIFRPFFETGAL